MERISSAGQFRELVDLINDEHSFIREVHVVSPTYVVPDSKSMVAAESRFGMRLWIASPEAGCPGLEFLFLGVELARVESARPLMVDGEVSETRVCVSLFSDGLPSIIAETCYYRRLFEDSWGPDLRLGSKDLFDGQGLLVQSEIQD